jgi:hypothetical protein
VKSIAARCGVRVEAGGESLISSAGASMLLQTAVVSGLAAGLSGGLAPWRQPRSMHVAMSTRSGSGVTARSGPAGVRGWARGRFVERGQSGVPAHGSCP